MPEVEIETFVVGDVVRLKSGGALMVVGVEPAVYFMPHPKDMPRVAVHWMTEDGVLHKDIAHPAMLEHVTRPAASPEARS